MSQIVKVGMADLKVVRDSDVLTTLGLGSCVGIALYDKVKRVAGLAHIMLPSSQQIKNNQNRAKFADTGIALLIEEMIKEGASVSRLTAKIAGGAQMFSFGNNASDLIKIGQRNSAATKEILAKYNIPILAEDTGGNYGRTIEFYASNGDLLVKTIGYGVKTI